MRLRENCWGRDFLCSSSTTQHHFSFFAIRVFENYMFKQILKVANVYLFWKGCVWEIIVKEEICCARLAQLSTTFLFSQFGFFKNICYTNFESGKCVFILKKMRLSENCWGRDFLCSPSTTQHNFFFYEIRIFENYMLYKFWKWQMCIYFEKDASGEIIVKEEICCARLAQLSTTFLFSQFAFLKIICLNKFWKWKMCIYFEKHASER